MGSFSSETSVAMRVSRTIKLVAEVSSSIKRTVLPAARASTVFAACEVLPLAFSVWKRVVSDFLGRLLINMEISVS